MAEEEGEQGQNMVAVKQEVAVKREGPPLKRRRLRRKTHLLNKIACPLVLEFIT